MELDQDSVSQTVPWEDYGAWLSGAEHCCCQQKVDGEGAAGDRSGSSPPPLHLAGKLSLGAEIGPLLESLAVTCAGG